MTIAREEYKNMIVTAVERFGTYEVSATVNGRIVGRFTTTDEMEAAEVYNENVYNMLAR